MNVLVVPTIRENSILEFLNHWDQEDWTIIIVEDNPQKSFRLVDVKHHYSWEEIDKELDDHWVISRRDSAIRSFGFLMAHRMGAEYIFTLDDDCHRFDYDFVKEHIDKLEHSPRWTESVPGQRTRGLPYRNLGELTNVALSVGLWEGIADFDAVHILGANMPEKVDLPNYNRILPQGQYFPMCGMNMCFKREIAPLMYFPLMGEGYPYRRFDDIWCGVIMKKVCDHLGLLVSVGKPFINHTKASDTFVNLAKEAPGIGANETFWEKVDAISLTGSTPEKCMTEIGYGLRTIEDDYLRKLGEAIIVWSKLFTNKS